MITFFDTHIFVYAVDSAEPVKQQKALARIEDAREKGAVALSTQVLQEFFSIATRKLRPPLSPSEATSMVKHLCEFQVLGTDAGSILAACELAKDHRLSLCDALVLEAALRSKADLLVSEVGQSGQKIGSMTIENPFLGT